MLGLGMASSHAPMLFEPLESWLNNINVDRIASGKVPVIDLGPENEKSSHIQPQVKRESQEVCKDYVRRIQAGFAVLRRQVEEYNPDAIIYIGDDQGDMFDEVNNPTFSVFTGSSCWGLTGGSFNPHESRKRVDYRTNPELASHILAELIARDFDVANLGSFEPRGSRNQGISHMVAHLAPKLDPDFEIPLIPIFINEYFPPLPSAARCYALGQALGSILAERPERVAICASGGLSHLGQGGLPIAYIDESLDRWILQALKRNDAEGLKRLFTFDSDTLGGGTGETRAWISVAGAMNRTATVVDYIPAYRALTGIAFTYWPASRMESERVVSKVEAALR